MSRVEDFSAELVSPEIFRDVCSLASTVGRICTLSARKSEELSQAADDEELVVCAVNMQNSLQMWVHLSSRTMFNSFRLSNSEWIQVKSDSLAHAFRNEAGLMSTSEVRMRVSHKPPRQGSSSMNASSQIVPQGARLMSFTMDVKSMDTAAAKAIEQRIYAEAIDSDATFAEPSLEGVRFWGDPTIGQLNQMAKVCDQYKQMSETVRVTISKSGIFTLVSEAPDAVANTSWRVDLAERADEPEEEDAQESLFVDEGEPGDVFSPSSSQRPRRKKLDSESCVVLAKDWAIVLQVRRICRRVVIGVLDNGGLVAYGFLKQGRNLSTQDVATFYLWHHGS